MTIVCNPPVGWTRHVDYGPAMNAAITVSAGYDQNRVLVEVLAEPDMGLEHRAAYGWWSTEGIVMDDDIGVPEWQLQALARSAYKYEPTALVLRGPAIPDAPNRPA